MYYLFKSTYNNKNIGDDQKQLAVPVIAGSSCGTSIFLLFKKNSKCESNKILIQPKSQSNNNSLHWFERTAKWRFWDYLFLTTDMPMIPVF
jgi:hypothetical protein